MPHVSGRKLLVASSRGHGLIVEENGVLAMKRGGKQVLNVPAGAEARVCTPMVGDTVSVIGENRKMLLFDVSDLPELTRGRGVLLQRYKDGGLSDAICFNYRDGLEVEDTSGRKRTFDDLSTWRGKRGQAGRLPPKGFPRRNRFRRHS